VKVGAEEGGGIVDTIKGKSVLLRGVDLLFISCCHEPKMLGKRGRGVGSWREEGGSEQGEKWGR